MVVAEIRLVRKAPTLTELVNGDGCFVMVGAAGEWMANSVELRIENGRITKSFIRRIGDQIRATQRIAVWLIHESEKTLPEHAVARGWSSSPCRFRLSARPRAPS